MISELIDLRAGRQIEYTNLGFIAAGRQIPTIRTEAHTMHGQMAIDKYTRLFTTCKIPQTHRQIGAAGCYVITIWMERNRLRKEDSFKI